VTVKARTVDDALTELAKVSARRNLAQGEERAAYARMVELFVELREAFPEPVIKRVIAEAAGLKLSAMDAALMKFSYQRGSKVR
jgi:hypothetical protein